MRAGPRASGAEEGDVAGVLRCFSVFCIGGQVNRNVSFVNHYSVNKLHTSVNVNPLFLALINGS